jgi:hypothetical protein
MAFGSPRAHRPQAKIDLDQTAVAVEGEKIHGRHAAVDGLARRKPWEAPDDLASILADVSSRGTASSADA